jgi:hypothetical protein
MQFLAAQKREKRKKRTNPWHEVFGALLILGLVEFFCPRYIPFSVMSFWHPKGNVVDWLISAWPLFAWGAGLTAIVALCTKNEHHVNRNAEDILTGGFAISLLAGVTEEIGFRWIAFLGTIPMLRLSNWVFFGWAGFGLPAWIQTHVLGPFADYTSLHALHSVLFSPQGWFVGAALLAANSHFRDGHKYLGWPGFVNSWFLGMFFFWMMFHYGLPAAILVHFLYDLFIFVVTYLDAAFERRMGWGRQSRLAYSSRRLR